MGVIRKIEDVFADGARMLVLLAASIVVIVIIGFRLRELSFAADPSLSASINIIGVFLSFTFAANALVRFRGTGDRMSLILALGFILSGVVELGVTVQMFHHVTDATGWFQSLGMSWMQGRLLLAEALLLSMAFDNRMPRSRTSESSFILGLTVAGTVFYVASAYYMGSGDPQIRPDAIFPRPFHFLPCAVFLLAGLGVQSRRDRACSALDRSLLAAVWLNLASHLLMVESTRVLDAQATFSQLLRVTSYAVVLGGTLLDNSRIFAQVQHLASSDALTGLANYRRLVDVLDAEIERFGRTGRAFSLILLDLDGLKRINDQYGHLVGSRALCRLAESLRSGSRSIDTAARYGGDEFAVVLPETGERAALLVSARIRANLSAQTEVPQLSVSTGVAVYPGSGKTAEKLLAAADRELYAMKLDTIRTVGATAREHFKPATSSSSFPEVVHTRRES